MGGGKSMPKYVGLDVHLRTCHATAMDGRGRVLKQEKLQNERRELERFFHGIHDAKIAMEPSYCWQPVYELLESMGYEVKLAHPLKTRVIAEAKIKTDAIDSEALAYLLRTGLLPTSYVPPKEVRELRELIGLRVYLVRERTKFKSKIRAELAKRGVHFESNPFAKRRVPQVKKLGITTVNRCFDVIGELNEQIERLSKELKQRAEKNEDAKLLMTIPGIDYFSALAILAEIGDIHRFRDPGKLCSYAGLVPSVHQSGTTKYHGRITKQGRKLLRWVLQECLWVHLRYDSYISRFFYRVARRRGRQKAAVAAARKLLVAVYWMLVRKEKFRS
jgi:transposase